MSGGGAFFSSPPLATNYLGFLPGRRRRYVQHAINVGPEAAVPVALALHKLYEAPLLEKV